MNSDIPYRNAPLATVTPSVPPGLRDPSVADDPAI